MTRHTKTQTIIDKALDTLQDAAPMTVRQCYYQLVSRQVLENSIGAYKSTCRALVAARKDGSIPWDWIEDRLRQPRHVAMWGSASDFTTQALRQFRLNVWNKQPASFEAWLEKDALSGIFEDTLEPYGVTLNVGRGYDGWTSIKDTAERYGDDRNVEILYFGDFDPSGEDMVRSLLERLRWFGAHVSIEKCALTFEDIERHGLPPNFTKITDTRRAKFVAQHGDVSVEIDALPIDVLRERIVSAVCERMDLEALADVRADEDAARKRLALGIGHRND